MIFRFAADSRGSTLILNLMAVTVFSMLVGVIYVAAKSQVTVVIYQERSAQARSIAEAGIEDALHSLYLNPYWRTGFNEKSFAGGSYTVTLTNDNPPDITSTGYSPGIFMLGPAVKSVSVATVLVSSGVPQKAVLANSLTVNGLIDAYDPLTTLTPSATEFLTGVTIWSNGKIDTGGAVCPPEAVMGDATYFQGEIAPDVGCVSGMITASTFTIPLPMSSCGTCETVNDNLTGITPSSAYNSAAQKLTVSAGETVTLSSGIYFFTQVFINGTGILNVDTSTGSVKIFYNNKWQESSTCAVNNLSKIPSRFLISDMIVGSHKVDLSCPAPLHAYLEGQTTHFDLRSPTEVYGHIYSSEITVQAGAKLHFDLGTGVTTLHADWDSGNGSWTEGYVRQ